MADNFRIEFLDLPDFVTDMRNGPRLLDAELLTAAKHISERAESLSNTYAPVWRGDAKGGIYAKAIGGTGGVSAIWGSTSDHAYWADRGRGPGKMPPKGALVGWHGVTEENEFVVRRAIGRKGTKGKPFVTRAFNEIKAGFALKEFSAAIQRVLAKIGGG